MVWKRDPDLFREEEVFPLENLIYLPLILVFSLRLSPFPSLFYWINVKNIEKQTTKHRNKFSRLDMGTMVLQKSLLTQGSYFLSKHHQPNGVNQDEDEGLKVSQML